MHKGLKEPHIFNVSSNPYVLIKNLAGVFNSAELARISQELDVNVTGLLQLGERHYQFALATPATEWRQKVSRLYYGAYNARRALTLKDSGTFSTDSSDHQKFDIIPDNLNNAVVYRQRLRDLRDDRNLADYNHLAVETDLLMPVPEAQVLVANFFSDCRAYLVAKGIQL